jgi:hypothetical protein
MGYIRQILLLDRDYRLVLALTDGLVGAGQALGGMELETVMEGMGDFR